MVGEGRIWSHISARPSPPDFNGLHSRQHDATAKLPSLRQPGAAASGPC